MEAGEHDILVVHSDREAPKIGCRVSLYRGRERLARRERFAHLCVIERAVAQVDR